MGSEHVRLISMDQGSALASIEILHQFLFVLSIDLRSLLNIDHFLFSDLHESTILSGWIAVRELDHRVKFQDHIFSSNPKWTNAQRKFEFLRNPKELMIKIHLVICDIFLLVRAHHFLNHAVHGEKNECLMRFYFAASYSRFSFITDNIRTRHDSNDHFSFVNETFVLWPLPAWSRYNESSPL